MQVLQAIHVCDFTAHSAPRSASNPNETEIYESVFDTTSNTSFDKLLVALILSKAAFIFA